MVYAKTEYGLRERQPGELAHATWVPFTAQTRMSGVDLAEDGSRALGAQGRGHRGDEVGARPRRPPHRRDRRRSSTASAPPAAPRSWSPSCAAGSPARALGVIHLKDVVKAGMRERFDEMRRMGIRTVMITGDNPLTARAIADEAGVDDFLAEATPEDKMALIKREQEGGKLVAMTGDGTNDAPALAQADVGVAMNTGTSAAKEAGNMVDLDSDPTKLIEIVEIGKQLLITRGALTTFSIANDIAKYFAIIPAMFAAVYPGLDALNIMRLHSPTSAILSAVIFNALIIVALIPLALRGVRYTPVERGRDAAPQPADLRPRRHHRPVHRHQAHRPAHPVHPRDLVMRLPTWLSPTPRRAARAARAHRPHRLLYPLAMTAVAQIPGSAAQGRRVAGHRRRQDRRQRDRRPVLHRQGRQPARPVLPDPAVRGGRRVRPDRHRGVEPRPGERRGHAARPGLVAANKTDDNAQAEPADPGLLAQRRPSARWKAWTGAGRTAPPTGVGAVLGGVPPRRDHRPGHPGRSASTRPARPPRSSPTYQGVRGASARQFGADYSTGVVTPDPRRRPGHTRRACRRRHRQRQRARPRDQPGLRASCRRRGWPRPAASPVDAVLQLVEPAHHGSCARLPGRSPRSTCVELNVDLDRTYPFHG